MTAQSVLQEAFEDEGYDVGEVTVNRGLVRVVLLTGDSSEGDLEEIVTNALGEDNVLGVNVTAESLDGHDGMSTVVSIRRRP